VSRQHGGTGLGLAIVKDLVALMGGDLGAKALEERGSEFWFELSFSIADAASDASARSAPAAPVGAAILVVDDLEENRELMALMLRGHNIVLASSGAEALEHLSAQHFDLVLMDVQMPRMDGKTTTKLIRQDPDHATLPIIAVSAHALPERIEAFLSAGMNDYLAKPIDPSALEAIILKWTGQAHPLGPTPSAAHMTILCAKFVARCEEDERALARLSPLEHPKEVRAIAHRLAGSAATFGFPDAGRAALTVDQAYAEGRLPTDAQIQAVLHALRFVRESSTPSGARNAPAS